LKLWILKVFCFGALLLWVGAVWTGTARAETSPQPIAVVVNQSVDITTLSPAQLRMIFAGRTQFWPDGSRIRVFVLPPKNDTHQLFCRHLLNIYPYQLERIWQRVVYSGQGEAPKIIDTAQAMQDAIGKTPGAIGYLSAPGQINKDIRMITVGEPL
jgi:ABC-type phosphate transport system substrate-binding protein|tara:strand:+ start:8720 stop:9187 length:468 start_codon:yes stop_codon:yes gene_type:complete